MDLTPILYSKLSLSLLTILALWLLRKLVLSIALQRFEDLRIRYQWRKTSGYISGILGILLVGWIWFEGFQSIATFLGLVAAGQRPPGRPREKICP